MIKINTTNVLPGITKIEVNVHGKPATCIIEMGEVLTEFCKKISEVNNVSPLEILCEILSLATMDLIGKEKKK